MGKAATQNSCAQLVNRSIGALILANFLFLGQKLPLMPWIAKWRTAAQLERTGRALDAWLAEHGRYPGNLAELMTSPAAQAQDPALYDAAGNRIQYLRLGLDQYLLRSFGPDSQPAKGSGKQDDIIHGNLSKPFSGGLLLDPAPAANSGFTTTWSPAGADGTWSPDERWIARIASNPETGERRLVVVDDTRSRILISDHDRVEEFFWVPGAHQAPQIIFSATGSDVHADGAWRWAIDTGTAVNMMPSADAKVKNSLPGTVVANGPDSAKSARYTIALMQPQLNESFFQLLALRLDGPDSQTPRNFLNPGNLYRCNWQEDTCHRPEGRDSRVEIRISPDQPWHQRGQLTPAQYAWTRLPVRGTAQELLEKWFDAARSEKLIQLRPYVLFYAIILQDQILDSPILAPDSLAQKRLRESADAMSDMLAGSADAARYLQLLVSGAERSTLAQHGSGSRPVFELIDAERTPAPAQQLRPEAASKPGGKKRDETNKKKKRP